MALREDVLKFNDSDTAEDLAKLVADARKIGQNPVRIAFEDFTIPDAAVFQEAVEIGGRSIRYIELFHGAIKHFNGEAPSSFTAIPTPDTIAMTPYSMSLAIWFGDEPPRPHDLAAHPAS
jgi:hypothetical protein